MKNFMKFLISANDFNKVFNAIKHFVVKPRGEYYNTKPVLRGILFQAFENHITFTALNGYNLCTLQVENYDESSFVNEPFKCIIPVFPPVKLSRNQKTVELKVNDKEVTVKYNDTTTTISIPKYFILEKYPNIDKIVPKIENMESEPSMEVTASSIMAATKGIPKTSLVRIENYGFCGIIYRFDCGFVYTTAGVGTQLHKYYIPKSEITNEN